ncbi:hypothetical protein MMEU_0989 [Mycobacterium marinum str. Europe]|nr:hypothetical protein MMEU_0989 [Mycobacterium marinum str. Europe]
MAPALAGGKGCQLLRSGWSVVVGGVLSQGRRRDPATASGADNLQRPGSRQDGHAGTTAEFTTTGRRQTRGPHLGAGGGDPRERPPFLHHGRLPAPTPASHRTLPAPRRPIPLRDAPNLTPPTGLCPRENH